MNALGRVVAVLLAAPAAASAQGTVLASTHADSVRVAESRVLVRATPREYTLSRIAAPAELPLNETVRYRVRVLGGATVISRLEGTLVAGDSLRSVLLTFGLRTRAAAGRAPVAEISFEAAGGRRAVVTVEVEVNVVRAVAIDLAQQAIGTRPGGTVVVRYRLTNQGNAADTVRLKYVLPFDWSAAGGDTVVVAMPAGSVIAREAMVHVPNAASPGSFAIEVRADNRAGTATAVDRMYVEVPPSRSAPSERSVSLNTSYTTSTGSAGGANALLGLAFAGTIFRDVDVSVDATSAPALTDQGRYRLSSLGQFPQPPNIMISRGPARLRIGGVGASFSELTGLGAGGRGASFGWESANLSVRTAFAGKGLGFGDGASTGMETEDPRVAGLRVSHHVAPNLWVTGTVAHLDEGNMALSRKLDVAGAGVLVPTLFGGTFEGELAYRRYADGAGLGLFSEFTRTAERERSQFRVLYAPGGTSAYAGSKANISGFLSRALSQRWQLGGQGWLTDNDGTQGQSARAVGAGILPQYFIRDGMSVGLDVAGSHQTLTSRGASFGNDEQHLSALFNHALDRQTGLSVIATGARITRSLSFDSTGAGGDASQSAGRASLLASVSRGTEHFGTLLLLGQVSRDESNTVGLPRQHQLALRLDRFPLYFSGGSHLFATGIVQQLGWFGDRPSVTTLRGDITAELPFGIALTFAADRNPLVSVAGAGPWSTSLRVSRTTYLTIPSFLRYGSRSGRVYQDLNGNGVEDPGEPGMGGVIVRRGEQSVTTDDDGTFHFNNLPGEHTERLRIDPRTLPAGWMDKGSPTNEEEAKRIRAIGIVPTSAVRLHLIIRREDRGIGGALDLTRVVLVAHDSLGRAYLAQPTDSATQAFSALPPGSYRITVDASSAGSQLQVAEAPAGFRVGAERSGQDYEVVLATRTVKLKTFGPPSAPAPAKPAAPATLPRRSTGAVADTVPVAPRPRPEKKP